MNRLVKTVLMLHSIINVSFVITTSNNKNAKKNNISVLISDYTNILFEKSKQIITE